MRPGSIPVVLSPATVGCALAADHSVWAQAAPRSFVASLDVHRVVAATWKPGHRDHWHSRGSPSAGYNLADCAVRLNATDGKFIDIQSKAGDSRVGTQAPSHSLENVGNAECMLILFVPK